MYSLDSGIDYDIVYHLAVAVPFKFGDSSSGIGRSFSHSYGDLNIIMRPKVVLNSSLTRQPALHIEITVIHFISIINITQRGM